MMVVIGVDAHKRTHTLVAVDEAGRRIAEKTVAATPDGHLEAVEWAAHWPERRFAIEDCRHLTRRLEVDLLRAGEAAVRVPPHLMAESARAAASGASPIRLMPTQSPARPFANRACLLSSSTDRLVI